MEQQPSTLKWPLLLTKSMIYREKGMTDSLFSRSTMCWRISVHVHEQLGRNLVATSNPQPFWPKPCISTSFLGTPFYPVTDLAIAHIKVYWCTWCSVKPRVSPCQLECIKIARISAVSERRFSPRLESVGVWSPKNIFQRPKFAGKSLKFRRKSDFCQIPGSEIRNFRARKNAIPYIPPLDSLL